MSRKKFARYKSASHDRPHGALSRGSARAGFSRARLRRQTLSLANRRYRSKGRPCTDITRFPSRMLRLVHRGVRASTSALGIGVDAKNSATPKEAVTPGVVPDTKRFSMRWELAPRDSSRLVRLFRARECKTPRPHNGRAVSVVRTQPAMTSATSCKTTSARDDVRVVECLEVIDVDHHERQRTIVTRAPLAFGMRSSSSRRRLKSRVRASKWLLSSMTSCRRADSMAVPRAWPVSRGRRPLVPSRCRLGVAGFERAHDACSHDERDRDRSRHGPHCCR